MRTLLILVDGMRPDALKDVKAAQDIIAKSSCAMDAQTVIPSVTLPCHMSLFHSVDPSRHGTTTNTYMPQVRPIKGICEVLLANKKRSAFFYNCEEIRDLSRQNSLAISYFCKGRDIGYDKANDMVSAAAIDYLNKDYIDFAFIYMGYTDAAGHGSGWMSSTYMEAIENSWRNINAVINSLPEDYTVIITADHGGHDRTHGTDMPEDMTIPMFYFGKQFEAGKRFCGGSILDIAPTIAKIMDVIPADEWEGTPVI